MIDLINTVLPIAGTIASVAAACVAVKSGRSTSARIGFAEQRVAAYADSARGFARVGEGSALDSMRSAVASSDALGTIKRERTIITSIARTAKTHAQAAKAERLKASADADDAALALESTRDVAARAETAAVEAEDIVANRA